MSKDELKELMRKYYMTSETAINLYVEANKGTVDYRKAKVIVRKIQEDFIYFCC